MNDVRELVSHPVAHTGGATLVAYLLILAAMTLLVFGVAFIVISSV